MKKILALLTLLITTPSYAFTLAPADQSAQYLGSLFGHIGDILQGNAGSTIGHLFFAFNFAMVLLCSILIVYTLFTGILSNSEDGEAMGRQPISKWVPIRMVMGIGLLLPSVSGYSVLQALVMWVVLQGAAAGDAIWNVAVDQLFKGGAVSPPATLTADPTANQALYTAATNLFSAQVCVNAMKNVYSSSANFSCQVQPIANQTNQYQIVCGGTVTDDNGNTNNLGNVCGTVTPNYSMVEQNYPNQNGLSNAGIYTALQGALTQMLTTIQPAATTLANDANQVLQGVPATQTQKVPGLAITNAVNVYQRVVGDAISSYVTAANQNFVGTNQIQQCSTTQVQQEEKYLENIWKKAGSDYYMAACSFDDFSSCLMRYEPMWHKLTSAQQQQVKQEYQLGQQAHKAQKQGQSEHQFVAENMESFAKQNHCYFGNGVAMASPEQMKATGWFSAGEYYLAIAEKSYLHANDLKLGQGANGGTQPLPTLQAQIIDTDHLQGNLWQTYAAAVKQYANADSVQYFSNPSAPGWITASQMPTSNNQGAEYVIQAINISLTQWSNLFSALQGDTSAHYANQKIQNRVQFYDPIMVLQQFGHDLLVNSVNAYKMEGAYFNQKSFSEWISNIFGNLFGNKDYDRMISAMWYLPLGTTVLSMMMAAGIMLSIYLPLIPFFLFALAGIGWLLGVIEAIVALPIVCFGIMHPRGDHDVLGKSEPGLFLLVNIFMRPALIIVSLLLGIGLIYIGITVINTGFAQVAGSMLTYSGNLRDPFTATCLMAIYTLFIVLVVQKCFSLISIVPDSVLRWLQGGNATQEQFGEMGKVMEQMDQMAGSGAQKLSQGVANTSQEQAKGDLSIAKNHAAVEDGMFNSGS